MLIGVGTILLLILLFGPQLWTQYIFRKYNVQIEDLPGTGGDLARHLVEKLDIQGANVEETGPNQDHYDPEQKIIRLSPDVFNGKSLTAVVIAAHEVGHALQHKLHYRPLYLRWHMARIVAFSEKIASILLLAFPFVIALTKIPVIGGLILLGGIMLLLMPVLFHLITLPVELDASFGRALPVLTSGRYIPESAVPFARRILTAAALTYLAASLASILNFYRWIIFLRR